VPSKFVVKLTAEAKTDLEEIDTYISAQSPKNAQLVKSRIASAVDSLELFPGRFNVHEKNIDPSKVVYLMTVRPFLVYYRVLELDRFVEVLTVRRGARDHPPRFFR